MHRRHWLILSLAIPLAVLTVFVALALTREAAQVPVAQLTPRDARIARFRHSVADNPTDYDSRLRLAWTYQQAKLYPEALDQYAIILKRRPRSVAALYYRGLIYRETGADPQAVEAFRSVLAIKKDHVLASVALGEYHLARSEYSGLLEVVGPAVKAHPKVAQLQYLAGRGLEGTGDIDGARTRYREALKYAPDLARARARLRRLDGSPE